MEVLGLHAEWAVFRDVWRDLIEQMSNPSVAEEMDIFKINDDDDDEVLCQ